MLEKTIERKVVAYCNAHNIWQQKLLGKKGMPDRIFYLQGGRAVAIEFKQPGKPLDDMQKICHRGLKVLGFPVYICSTYEDGIEFLQQEMGKFYA